MIKICHKKVTQCINVSSFIAIPVRSNGYQSNVIWEVYISIYYYTSSTNNFSWPKRRIESQKPAAAKSRRLDILFKPGDFERIPEQSEIISVCNAWTMSRWISKGWIELEGSPQYLQKLYSICPEIYFNFYSGSKGQPSADPCVHVDIRSRNKNVWFRNWKNSSQLFYLQVKRKEILMNFPSKF